MAESKFSLVPSRRYPEGYDRTGEGIETFKGLLQGMGPDLVGSFADIAGLVGEGATSLPPVTPNILMLQQMQGLDKIAGSEVLGEKTFGKAPTELRQKMRDDARLVGGAIGLGEIATAKGADLLSDGIASFIKYMKNKNTPVAVTPEGQIVPVPRSPDQDLPDTSRTEMMGGEEAARAFPEITKSRELAEKLYKAKEADFANKENVYSLADDIFRETKKQTGFGTGPSIIYDADGKPTVTFYTEFEADLSDINFGTDAPMDSIVHDMYDFFDYGSLEGGNVITYLDNNMGLPTEPGFGKFFDSPLSEHLPSDHPIMQAYGDFINQYELRISETTPNGELGHFNSYDKRITIRADQLNSSDPDQFRSIMIHELQHLLQDVEGLPQGGMGFTLTDYQKISDEFVKRLDEVDRNIRTGLDQGTYNIGNLSQANPQSENGRIYQALNMARDDILSKNNMPINMRSRAMVYPGPMDQGAKLDPNNLAMREEVLARAKEIMANRYQGAIQKQQKVMKALGITENSYDNYFRIMGEKVARSSEEREKLFAEIRELERSQRKATSPAALERIEDRLFELRVRAETAPIGVFAPGGFDMKDVIKEVGPMGVQYPTGKGGIQGMVPKINEAARRRKVETWHGAGTDFDKFDLHYVKTGEGANMFGHGIYLSDLRQVGETYKRNVGFRKELDPFAEEDDLNMTVGRFNLERVTDPETGRPKLFVEDNEELGDLLDELVYGIGADNANTNLAKGFTDYAFDDGKTLRLKNAVHVDEKTGVERDGFEVIGLGPSDGTLMQVAMDINPRTEMIDFYRPMEDQHPAVREKVLAIARKIGDEKLIKEVERGRADGQGVLLSIAKFYGGSSLDDPRISVLLNNNGIKGTKYSTRGTRYDRLDPEADDFNYVVFDAATLEILKKYGFAGTVGIGTGAALTETRPTDQPQEFAKGGHVKAGIAKFIPFMRQGGEVESRANEFAEAVESNFQANLLLDNASPEELIEEFGIEGYAALLHAAGRSQKEGADPNRSSNVYFSLQGNPERQGKLFDLYEDSDMFSPPATAEDHPLLALDVLRGRNTPPKANPAAGPSQELLNLRHLKKLSDRELSKNIKKLKQGEMDIEDVFTNIFKYSGPQMGMAKGGPVKAGIAQFIKHMQ
tara:strand:+ start:968 stop:4387 length:3420 start_codon:yes stop_codon:yes gene_type:complete